MARGSRVKTQSKGRSCTGKARHDTRAAARKALESLIRAKKARRAWNDVYACRFCDGWHVGHKPGLGR